MVSVKPAAALSILCLLFLGCAHRQPARSPDAVYKDALRQFQLGDFGPALAEINNTLARPNFAQGLDAYRCRLLKAQILIWQGYEREAIAILTPAPPGAPRALDERRLVLLGIADSNLQSFALAAQYFHQAQALGAIAEPDTECMLLLGQGKLAAIDGRYAEAGDSFRHALAIAQSAALPLSQTSAIGDLGMLAMKQRHYEAAVDWFDAALLVARAQSEGAPLVRLLGNLGWAYLETGDLERSQENFVRAAAMAQQNGMTSDEETWLSNSGAVQLMQGENTLAHAAFERALALARSLEDRQDTIYNLNDLTRIAILREDFAAAEKLNQEAIALERAIGDHESELYSRLNTSLILFGKGNIDGCEKELRPLLLQRGMNSRLRADALDVLAKAEARQHHPAQALLDFRRGAALLDQAATRLRRPELELSYPTYAEQLYDDYVHYLVSSGESTTALTVIDEHRTRTLPSIRPTKPTPAITSQELLRGAGSASQVTLAYWIGTRSSFVWLVSGHQVHMASLPGRQALTALVQRYEQQLRSPFSNSPAARATAQQLYDALIGPVARWIPPGAAVRLIPDGSLWELNFETLVPPAHPSHYWIEDVSITVSYTLEGARARHDRRTPEKLLVIGTSNPPGNYRPLAHAQEEVAAITRYFSKTSERVLTGAAANPTAYLDADPEDYSIIHFVAHGAANRTSPLDAAIVLSSDGHSSRLYARQVMARPIHARLVIISSCDGAGDRIYSAQGLVGMSWAFLRAGADHVIAALWAVDDFSTPHFMDSLYQAMSTGQSPEAALRSAKLAMIHSKSAYAKPFYWAPFVFYSRK